mmetsp:Transcript_14004/g.23918  ORF Transcript_14004/g.23918 Transcript_14004/m.23918 type:complete len:216 (-) Transcript_14004:401-1048(-)
MHFARSVNANTEFAVTSNKGPAINAYSKASSNSPKWNKTRAATSAASCDPWNDGSSESAWILTTKGEISGQNASASTSSVLSAWMRSSSSGSSNRNSADAALDGITISIAAMLLFSATTGGFCSVSGCFSDLILLGSCGRSASKVRLRFDLGSAFFSSFVLVTFFTSRFCSSCFSSLFSCFARLLLLGVLNFSVSTSSTLSSSTPTSTSTAGVSG